VILGFSKLEYWPSFCITEGGENLEILKFRRMVRDVNRSTTKRISPWPNEKETHLLTLANLDEPPRFMGHHRALLLDLKIGSGLAQMREPSDVLRVKYFVY